jgi:hypothetical protein
MESLSRKIKLKIKDKSIDIPLITDFEQLNNEIISILEKEYNQKLPREKKLFNLHYFDEDNDKYFINSVNDYTYFVNGSYNELFVDLNEFSFNNQIDNIEKINKESSSENELQLIQKIDELSKINLELKKEKEISNEKNKIYLEKIKILEEDKKLKQEKEQSILQCLAQEKKEKNEILEELEESRKLNQSMSFTINNLSTIVKDDDSPKDILVENLKEEKTLLENQLNEEREKIDLIEKIYSEDNKNLQQKLDNLTNEFNKEKQQMIEKSNLIIKTEIEKGINDYINKSKLELQNKENEINNIKNEYDNNLNKIREECYEEISQQFSKLYEQKVKDIYNKVLNDSKVMYDQIISQNQQQFEEEEKKRNQVIDANIFNNAHDNFNINPISNCKTIHNGVSCSYCKRSPIIGYRYKCMKCPDYNLCQICEKVVEHEHNFIRYATEEKN